MIKYLASFVGVLAALVAVVTFVRQGEWLAAFAAVIVMYALVGLTLHVIAAQNRAIAAAMERHPAGRGLK